MKLFVSVVPEFIQNLPTLALLGAAWAAYALMGKFYLRGVRRVRLFS